MSDLRSLLLALSVALCASQFWAPSGHAQTEAEPPAAESADVVAPEAQPEAPDAQSTPGESADAAQTEAQTDIRDAMPVAASDVIVLGGVDYAEWLVDASRAESLITSGTASTTFLDNLRSTLVNWRTQFLAAENTNDARIATLQSQIDSLGPTPEDGSPEPPAIAERRAELAESLRLAQVPRLAALEGFNRANGLIAEIDALLRARQQQELLQLDPSPVNPVNWPIALQDLRVLFSGISTEFTSRLRNPATVSAAMDNAPVLALFSLLGLLALLRGRTWMVGLTQRLQRSSYKRGRAATTFVVSLLQIGVAFGGILVLVTAIDWSGFAPVALLQIVQVLATLVVSTVAAIWLSGRLFPEVDPPLGVLNLDETARLSSRRILKWIGLVVGLALVAETITNLPGVTITTQGVVQTPIYLWLGFLFWRAGKILRLRPAASGDEEEEVSAFLRGSFGILSRGLMGVAVVGPLLAVIGYVNAAEALMVPTALSVALFGVLVALQPVVRDLYALVFRTGRDAAAEALIPVLVNFGLAFIALPLLALFWGMRPEQLSEVYARFWEGIPIGGARITPGNIFAVILVFMLGFLVTRLLQGALKTTVLPRTQMDTGARNALTSGVGYVGIGLAALTAITAGGIDLTAIGFVLGALSVGIGFGLQNVVNNFVSGIILLIERPISEGDWVEVGGNMGIVKSISVRSTRIETFDRTDVIVPNADFISGTVTNWTRGNTIGRVIANVGVAYGTDTRRLDRILNEIARETPGVVQFPEPGVDFLGFGADSLDFRVRVILRDINQMMVVTTELHHRIAERFTEEGIEIPFAQRDVWLRNPETLGAAGTNPSTPPKPSEEDTEQ